MMRSLDPEIQARLEALQHYKIKGEFFRELEIL
jgi:hypothetical protein